MNNYAGFLIIYPSQPLFMKKKSTTFFFISFLLCLYADAQLRFPMDSATEKITYLSSESPGIGKAEMYGRTKAWFLQYYKTSRFEDHLKITRKGKPLNLVEDKSMQSISGKGGFYVMYPNDRSGLNMEQTFIMFTLTVQFSDTAFQAQITDILCIGAQTSQQDMRPPEYPLEAYNERRLNEKDYVQDFVIPQVTNGIRKVQEELSAAIRNGPIQSSK
jgi:hypothetical protein